MYTCIRVYFPCFFLNVNTWHSWKLWNTTTTLKLSYIIKSQTIGSGPFVPRSFHGIPSTQHNRKQKQMKKQQDQNVGLGSHHLPSPKPTGPRFFWLPLAPWVPSCPVSAHCTLPGHIEPISPVKPWIRQTWTGRGGGGGRDRPPNPPCTFPQVSWALRSRSCCPKEVCAHV